MRIDSLRRYFPVVQSIAGLSKDQKVKVGAIALSSDGQILSTGYNGMPRGLDDANPERQVKPEKLFWFCHAEENLVAQAARAGVALKGCTVIVTPLFPCSCCARMLIQAGVARVVVHQDTNLTHSTEKWFQESLRAQMMFHETGVHLTIHEF